MGEKSRASAGSKTNWIRTGVTHLIWIAGALIGLVFGPRIIGPVVGGGLGAALALVIVAWRLHHQVRGMATETLESGASKASFRLASAICAWMAIYIAAVVTISWIFEIDAWPLWARIIAALAPALPIGGVILALLGYLTTEPDEFQRMLMTRAVLTAMGVAFFVFTAWGFLELYVGAPHLSGSLMMPVFWAAFGITSAWVRWENR